MTSRLAHTEASGIRHGVSQMAKLERDDMDGDSESGPSNIRDSGLGTPNARLSAAAPTKKKKGMGEKKQMFGLAQEKPPAYILPEDYEHRYPPDDFGEEMGPNARVWRVYLDEAELNDHDMVKEWKDGIDALLVFAGLFSAVVTTFVAQTSQKLDVDYGQVSASLLAELITVQRKMMDGGNSQDVPPSELNLSSPTISKADAWVNGLWFTSLSLSLVVALAVVLIKQWIQQYVSFVSGTPQERARIHHFRYLGLQRWAVPAIIGVLPFLLHAALFLFFLGLVVFLQALKVEIASIVGLLGGGVFALYAVSNILPVYYPQCPYRTPLIGHVRPVVTLGVFGCRQIAFYLIHRAIPQVLSHYWVAVLWRGPLAGVRRWYYEALFTSPPTYDSRPFKVSELEAALDSQDEIVSQIIHWLLSSSSNPSVKPVALQSISGLRLGFSRTEQMLGQGTWVRQELLRELGKQHYTTVAVRNDLERFINTPLFYDVERTLRASMFIPADHADGFPSVWMPVGRLHVQTHISDTKIALALTTYMVENARDNEEVAREILITLCELVGTAESYPMVWQAWCNGLDFYQYMLHRAFICPGPGLIGAHHHLQPLFKALLDTPTVQTWAAVLPFLLKVLSPWQYIPSSHLDLPKNVKLMTDKDVSLRVLELCKLLMNGVAVECRDDPFRVADAEEVIVTITEGLLGLLVSAHSMDTVLHETSGELFRLPFFANDHWNFTTYESAFELYLYPHQDSYIWSRPLEPLSPECLPSLLKSVNCTRALLQPVYLEDTKVNMHIAHTIARFLDSQGGSRDNNGMVRNVFDAIVELRQPRQPNESLAEQPQAKQWHIHLQPLMHSVLAHLIAQDEMGGSHLSRAPSPISNALIEQADTFVFACSTFFLHESQSIRVTFGKDSEILLKLAQHHKGKAGALSVWCELLAWVATQSTKMHLEEWRHRYWDREDFDRYTRMADFVDQLASTLEIGEGEWELLRFEEDYIARVIRNRLRSPYGRKQVTPQGDVSSYISKIQDAVKQDGGLLQA